MNTRWNLNVSIFDSPVDAYASYLWWTFMIESGLIPLRCLPNYMKTTEGRHRFYCIEHFNGQLHRFESFKCWSSRFPCIIIMLMALLMRYDIIIRPYAWVKVLMVAIIFRKESTLSLARIVIVLPFHPDSLPCTKYINSRVNILWFR